MDRGYVLHSRWTLEHGRDEVWTALDALLTTDNPLAWWPGITVLDCADDLLSLRVRSGLGYALRFDLSGLTTCPPRELSFNATGDLHGRGVVSFVEQGPTTVVEVDWRVDAQRAWMRRTQWLLRPVYVLGHRWVMGRGERHFNRWMSREKILKDQTGTV